MCRLLHISVFLTQIQTHLLCFLPLHCYYKISLVEPQPPPAKKPNQPSSNWKRVTKQTKFSYENWNLIRDSKLNRFLVILFARGSELFEHSLYHLIKKRQKKSIFDCLVCSRRQRENSCGISAQKEIATSWTDTSLLLEVIKTAIYYTSLSYFLSYPSR